MAILIDEQTTVLVQGITGRDGSFHTQQMLDYGTRVVGGVTPGKGGQEIHGLPVYNSVQEATAEQEISATVIYVPAAFAKKAILEAAEAGIGLIICITEGVPVIDMVEAYRRVQELGVRLIGPNCPGLISPDLCKIGIMPAVIHKKGSVGVISRSGTLTYEIVYALTLAGIGQSTCVGIGGDPIIGTGYRDLLPLYEQDDETEAIVMVGEIGGNEEEKTAAFIQEHISKPVFSFIVGQTAPEGKQMGHAGAIVSGAGGTADSKREALNSAGVPVARTIDEVAGMVKEHFGV